VNAREFLASLRKEVESHPGVNHPVLSRLSQVPFTREDYLVMGLQHYPLVGTFTTYLEHLLLRGPDSDAKQWIAKVLVDEYGEGSEGKDHAELYREFLGSCGAAPGEELDTPLHPAIPNFIDEHLRIVTEEPFLVGLGALGPGHEWSIPRMFHQILRGLRRAGFSESEITYFSLHVEQDVDHGRWLEEALARFSDDSENQASILRGARLSLAARARFWSGVQQKIVRWRQPRTLHSRPQAGDRKAAEETTLAAHRRARAQRPVGNVA
jgi:pyrroloquinoline quinone (PQQ) biosynthesis protein C